VTAGVTLYECEGPYTLALLQSTTSVSAAIEQDALCLPENQ